MSMLVVGQKKGQHFIKKGERVCEIMIIMSGSVELRTSNDIFILEAGSVIGLLESYTGRYACDYVAAEDALIVTYAYENVEDFKKIFTEQPQYVYAFLHATMVLTKTLVGRHQELSVLSRDIYLYVVKQYREYQLMCKQYELEPITFEAAAAIKPVELEHCIRQWEIQYVDALIAQPPEIMKQFYTLKQSLTVGEILRNSKLMNKSIHNMEILVEYNSQKAQLFYSEEGDNIFSLWFDLAKKLACMELPHDDVDKKVRELQEYLLAKNLLSGDKVIKAFQEYWKFDFIEYARTNNQPVDKASADLADLDIDFFEYIINYVDYEGDRKNELRELMEEYAVVIEKEAKDPQAMNIRGRVCTLFFDIYEKAFFKSIQSEDEEVSPILQLFFQFGLLNPKLVSEEHISQLFELNRRIREEKDPHIFTMYEWLKMIYIGMRNTSRNEFDLDYEGSLREMRKVNKITADEEKSLQFDRERMVRYEIENMFRSASRGTYGRGGVYTPVLDDNAISANPANMFVSVDKLNEAINKIKEIDFGCFYREIMFYDLEHNTGHFLIQKEIMPDIILFPNAGNNALMWQETEGTMRESSARFLFPIFTVEDVDNMMLQTIGRYRWEICRRIMGMRWKDISEHSLTAEYYDYLEYYKKNSVLSAEAKEKVKSALTRTKGNYREVFAADYVNWIKYESKGNFRLNKVSRDILSRYCPFNKDIRLKLMENPMFRNVFNKYDNLMEKKRTQIRNSLSHYKKAGGEITEELREHLDFYNK